MTGKAVMSRSVYLGNGFTGQGVAAPASNHREVEPTVAGDKNPVVLAWIRDQPGCYPLLLVNALTGDHKQFPTPRIGDDPFASVIPSANR